MISWQRSRSRLEHAFVACDGGVVSERIDSGDSIAAKIRKLWWDSIELLLSFKTKGWNNALGMESIEWWSYLLCSSLYDTSTFCLAGCQNGNRLFVTHDRPEPQNRLHGGHATDQRKPPSYFSWFLGCIICASTTNTSSVSATTTCIALYSICLFCPNNSKSTSLLSS